MRLPLDHPLEEWESGVPALPLSPGGPLTPCLHQRHLPLLLIRTEPSPKASRALLPSTHLTSCMTSQSPPQATERIVNERYLSPV